MQSNLFFALGEIEIPSSWFKIIWIKVVFPIPLPPVNATFALTEFEKMHFQTEPYPQILY